METTKGRSGMKKGHVPGSRYTWPFLLDDSRRGMSGLPYQGMLTAGMADVESIATPLHAKACQHLITILYATRANHEPMICGYPESYKVASNHGDRFCSPIAAPVAPPVDWSEGDSCRNQRSAIRLHYTFGDPAYQECCQNHPGDNSRHGEMVNQGAEQPLAQRKRTHAQA